MDDNEIKRNRIRNGLIGAGIGAAGGSKIEEIVKKYPERVMYTGIAGLFGYFLARMKEKGTYKKVADYVKDKAGYGPKNPTQQ